MTFIQPKKNTRALTNILISLVLLLLPEVIILITIYNHTVNLQHGITAMNHHREKLEAESSMLRDKMFSLMSTEGVQQFAESRGLIQDKKPQYFKVNQWVFASQ